MYPLSKFPVLRTQDADECIDVVSKHVVPHDFRTKAGATAFTAILNTVPLQDSSITYLRYGTGIKVASAANDCFLVVAPLSGSIRFSLAGSEGKLSRDLGVIIRPGRAFDLETEIWSSALIWKVDTASIRGRASHLSGAAAAEPDLFEPFLDWSDRRSGPLFRSLKFVAQELDELDSAGDVREGWAQRFEQLLIHALVTARPNERPIEHAPDVGRMAPRCVRRVEAYIDAHSDEPLTIEDLEQVAGVSQRSLFRAFRDFRGTSPMQCLRETRLRRVRQDLMRAGSGTSVADILARRGISEFGRFAAQYRRRFGETPSQTLRR